MSSYTKNLNLLKKDPLADGADTFNISTMLNDNWDKIDAAYGDIPEMDFVPNSRKVNGKPLSSDVTLTASDVGARPNTWTPTAAQVGAVPTSRTINGKQLTSNITLDVEDVGAAPSSHTHAASEIASGTFSTSRLPTIPLTKGGTGQTTAAKSLYALINGCLSLTDATIASGDYFALLDTSAATGKKITLSDLCDYLNANLTLPNVAIGSYVGTGTEGNANRNSLSFPFSPRVVIVSGEVEGSSITMIAVKPVYYVPVIEAYSGVNGGGVSSNNAFWSTNSFSWYSDAGVIQQLNYDGVTYGYAAFG